MATPSSSTANSSTKHISLPSFFSEGDPTEWLKRYEICCNTNDWGDELKAKKLPTLLEGEVLVTWLELTCEQQSNYELAKTKILERMGPIRFVSMGDFHHRRLLPGESLSVFSHELKRLIDQVMPTADAAIRQQLLIHQFLTGLPAEISKRLRAAGEIDDLGQLIQRAKLLMHFPGRSTQTLNTVLQLCYFLYLQKIYDNNNSLTLLFIKFTEHLLKTFQFPLGGTNFLFLGTKSFGPNYACMMA